ncbi:5-methyltetrahydropteroyltriglutamate--homocysteine S-methyltransferase [Oceaniovalibus sp. ACAM 378]|uniref:5-methyltetrahydropteroyltriglutamate-- homocysteine S-methyltransferase n=1 Tax=Oceaniovalibus sp. ACAM 378 TaxID=2599923 RepID=UPI0011D61224|nr:5-methyltetrahydropteroyltriglutamate--homocysteine S-methyltransferase [Oceaniovalibus sp. ACAM 378]TYB89442.1 5-methyltetrahydropteroyltriglutamate--homocysteine S-methyltransferase [Oceaniovalibus sp. ACAM 378]
MVTAANLGFPRIGAKRELKHAIESFWREETSQTELQRSASDLRAQNWKVQQDAGIDAIPSNDFSLYDQVLDTTLMLGAVPARFGTGADLSTYFAMARGTKDAPAMEMTKWFDTNYHYIVPEFTEGMTLQLASTKPLDEFLEAKALGIETRPVLVGPVTWLALGKAKTPGFDPLTLLPQVIAAYGDLLRQLAGAGASWVQIDEPILARDLSEAEVDALKSTYGALSDAGPKIMLTSYFDALRDNLALAAALPVAGLHVDLVRAPDQLDDVLAAIGDKHLSLGLIDGRNVWRADLTACLAIAERAVAAIGADRVQIAPSCSMLHVPVDLDHETGLDAELRGWLAFAQQKLTEIVAVTRALNGQKSDVAAAFAASDTAAATRRASPRIHAPAVKERAAGVTQADSRRATPFAKRILQQQAQLGLPDFPTTTIGSFPQTAEIRQARALHRKGELSDVEYDRFLKDRTRECVAWQEEAGLDVLVHGEFERNDMVEYFGEQLAGFAFTKNGWVQSYGTRCVKPPLIYGDVSRPKAMTVEWARFAQSLTPRPMKGMLTGPVTILQWSFVRDDQPRVQTCQQIALAIRDEVTDLEAAGIKVIQIDEPALREGLPLRHADWQDYLDWAVATFRLSASGVQDATQIHTHMCYSEFNDIMPAIAAMDADVISIETSRSDMELLKVFADFNYPNQIGPGVWDIHSPRVPAQGEMETLLRKAAEVIDPAKLWVNPDCGLKTRQWDEVRRSTAYLVGAARVLREKRAVAAE